MINTGSLDLKNFEEYLRKQGLADGSIVQYLSQVKLFSFMYDPMGEKEKLFSEINQFVEGNKRFGMFALKHFLIYTGREGVWLEYYDKHGKFIRQKDRKILIKAIAFSDLKAIKDNMISPYNIIIAIQYEGCFRIDEVLKLMRMSVRDMGDRLELATIGKGGEPIVATIINPDTVQSIRAMLASREYGDRLFDVSVKTVNNNYKRAAAIVLGDSIGKTFSTHWVRHSRGVDVWNKTKDIMAVKIIMRHKRIETTYIYLKSCGILEKDIVERSPIAW